MVEVLPGMTGVSIFFLLEVFPGLNGILIFLLVELLTGIYVYLGRGNPRYEYIHR